MDVKPGEAREADPLVTEVKEVKEPKDKPVLGIRKLHLGN